MRVQRSAEQACSNTERGRGRASGFLLVLGIGRSCSSLFCLTPPLTTATIISNAAELADTVGYEAMKVSEVARRLGVRAPSLYSHVRDLSDLRDGVTALALGELADLIAEAIAGRSGRLALRGFAEAHRTYAQNSPARWQSLQRRAGAAAGESDSARRLVALTDAVLLGYRLSPVDRVHATRLIGSTNNGFLSLESIGSFDRSAPTSSESWDAALEALNSLLTAWPSTPDNDSPLHER